MTGFIKERRSNALDIILVMHREEIDGKTVIFYSVAYNVK